jgi:bifunctional non-homologous end joining protein LigD
MSLTQYQAKRNFARTAEPQGKRASRAAAAGSKTSRFLYIIQKHAARRLHYDFRLELDGVLKSWALPKGVPTTQGEKRLAVHVEDHPVEYAKFEGIIPEGNYGAGTVMLWDAGICESTDDQPSAALRRGKLSFRLTGQKLRGDWALVRIGPQRSGKSRGEQDDNSWLLIKTEKSVRAISARADDCSVVSERSMKEIAADGDATWQSNRKSNGPNAGQKHRAAQPSRARRSNAGTAPRQSKRARARPRLSVPRSAGSRRPRAKQSSRAPSRSSARAQN